MAATATLTGNTSSPATVYVSILPLGAYDIATGAAIVNPAPLTNVTGQWSITLELNTAITPAGNFWQVWENVPGADKIWAVRLETANATQTVQQSQILQRIG